jgi:chemotaxis response regulator CheB
MFNMESSAGDFRIVCLCGSAGALQAYLEILRVLPEDTGMAFVVIAHRGAQNPDLLPALLSGATKMQVVEARQDMALQPNTVYVCPPLKDMLFDDSGFQLRPRSKPFGSPQTITCSSIPRRQRSGIELSP